MGYRPDVTERLPLRIDAIAAAAEDHHDFRAQADRLLRRTIGYDVASWASLDPSTHLFTSCDVIAGFGSPPHEPGFERELFALEFADHDPLTYSKIIASDRRAVRLRAEVAEPEAVERYRRLLAPAGASDEMRVVLRDGTGVWGALTLYRAEWWEPFEESSEQLMEGLSSHLAASFRHAFLLASLGVGKRPPGTITLSPSGEIATTSEPAERWLDTLHGEQVRGTLSGLAARLSGETIARATVVGSEGPVTFHAFPRKGSDDQLDVVVEQPRPAELAEVIMAAHGLSPREAEVTRLVMQGLTTRAMAGRLAISEYTVQDHLKSTFAKFDVVTRGELLDAVYSRHYLPRREKDAVPGPYGFFLH